MSASDLIKLRPNLARRGPSTYDGQALLTRLGTVLDCFLAVCRLAGGFREPRQKTDAPLSSQRKA